MNTDKAKHIPQEQRRLGAHVSTAGGLHTAFERATAAGCDAIQVFVKNQRQWRAKPLDDEAVAAWNTAREQSGIDTVVAHDAYLINLAAPQDDIWRKSIDAFCDELTRCRQTGIRWLVTHPGSHNGNGEAWGIQRVARALEIIEQQVQASRGVYPRAPNHREDHLGASAGSGVCTLLEVTAGQGTNLGYRFEHLAEIVAATKAKCEVGVCLDTCHMFAAGYDLTTDEGYAQTVAAIESTVGAAAVKCIHMNDCKKPLGSRVDRHEHIGKGHIGREAFGRFINDRRFLGVPMILETPKEKDARGRDMDRVNLATLRRLIGNRSATRTS